MPVEAGQNLLHYRIVDKLGEGGMGTVWRAIDTTLEREAALKFLPAAFSADPERLARFEREAKVLASLNHPNVAAIHGFHHDQEVRFLVMELVPGEDLAERLARGPLSIPEALDAARQIADALETAHDGGVVHRDLKPANVKRTPDGQIKVLDFGLAKALESAAPNSGQSATMTSAGSVAGMILGTVSYMSPEQARGQVVDKRTDLWAFGCVLYEMLSGAKAFDGPTVTDVLASVVTSEPDWDKLPTATPAAVRRLLRRCLAKNPNKRLKDAGDASLLLEDNPEDARAQPVASARRSSRWVLAAIAIAIAAAIAGAAGALWVKHRGTSATTAPTVAFHRLTFARGMMRAARFAPDGQTIVYGAAWGGPPMRLYLSRVNSPDATPVTLPPAELLSIASTGEMAVSLGHAYVGWMGEGRLARASLLGGNPREILEHIRAADWSPDGSELAIVRRVDGLDQLEYPAGTVLHKTAGYIADVRISPDGNLIAFADHPVYSDDLGDLAIVDRAGNKTTLQADLVSIRGVAWAPGGTEIWFTAVHDSNYDLLASDLAGRARIVYRSVSSIELFDIDADGRVLLGAQSRERQSQALLAGYSEARNLIVPGESSFTRGPAADGRSILVANQEAKDYETYLVRTDRPGATRLSSGDAMGISPKGDFALAISTDLKTLLLSPLGMGQTREVPNPEGLRYESQPAWLPDGKRLVVLTRRGNEESRACTIDIDSGAHEAFGAPGAFWGFWGIPPVSPDGKFVVLQDAAGVPRRWPVEGGEPLPIPGLGEHDLPLTWTEDGAALYVGGDTVPMQILRLDLATGQRTPWITISPTDTSGLRIVAAAITPNGKYWSLSISKLLTDLYVVDGLL